MAGILITGPAGNAHRFPEVEADEQRIKEVRLWRIFNQAEWTEETITHRHQLVGVC